MISAAVMAHPRRRRWVPRIVSKLACDAQVVWDGGWNDRHVTGLRCLRSYDPEASHHLIVQDDILLCRDLAAAVERMVSYTGEHPVCLYLGMTRPHREHFEAVADAARQERRSWVETHGPVWGQGLVLPTAHIDDLAGWYEQQSTPNYDRRIGRWYGMRGITCWYTVPSLVDHREQAVNPSLVRGRTGRNRVAHWFIGEDASALDVDWSTAPLRPEGER